MGLISGNMFELKTYNKLVEMHRVKLSWYMPWKRLVGEEVQLLLILDLGTRWG
jgi:hypothetical protein